MALVSNRSIIADFIKSQPGTCFCDACILTKLRLANLSIANESTRQLAKGGIVNGFSRLVGRCVRCGKTTSLVIQYRNPK